MDIMLVIGITPQKAISSRAPRLGHKQKTPAAEPSSAEFLSRPGGAVAVVVVSRLPRISGRYLIVPPLWGYYLPTLPYPTLEVGTGRACAPPYPTLEAERGTSYPLPRQVRRTLVLAVTRPGPVLSTTRGCEGAAISISLLRPRAVHPAPKRGRLARRRDRSRSLGHIYSTCRGGCPNLGAEAFQPPLTVPLHLRAQLAP